MPVSFTFDEFSKWHDDYANQFLEPALFTANRALNDYLDGELREFERRRVRVTPGRVKSKGRTWDKVNDARYRENISLSDIPNVIDDLVGLRIICTNVSDVQGIIDLLTSLRECDAMDRPVLGRQRDSVRDYLKSPKPSGYRAWHVNLLTTVSLGMEWHVVVCELQVRSLLQESWGELTHEDTYKPSTAVSPFFQTLSQRMAELLVTLDDMAQDLRTELERDSDEAADKEGEGQPDTDDPANAGADLPQMHNRDPVMRYLRQLVDQLERPMDLASLAWAVQREFGQDISRGWFGFRSFKEMLLAAAPSVRLDGGPPAHVLPANFVMHVDSVTDAKFSGVPDAALLLKRVDPSFPLGSHAEMKQLYEVLSVATHEVDWPDREADMRLVNELTKMGRDASASAGSPVSRRPLNYVARALLFSANLRPDMSAQDIAGGFKDATMTRLRGVAPMTEEDAREMIAWLDGVPNEEV